MKHFSFLFLILLTIPFLGNAQTELECNKYNSQILDISELETTVQKINCGTKPIVTTTAIHNRAFEKVANVAMNAASNKINQDLTSKYFNFPQKEVILPAPEIFQALFPLIKLAPEIANMYLTDRIKNMGAKEFIGLCKQDMDLCAAMMVFNLYQKIRSGKNGEKVSYNKMIENYQNNVEKLADQIGQKVATIETAIRKSAIKVYNSYQFINNGFSSKNALTGESVFRELPPGAGPIEAKMKSVINLIKLHPYEFNLSNTRLNNIRFGKINIRKVADNTYSFSTCLSFGVQGNMKLKEKDGNMRDVINSNFNISTGNCKTWVALSATSYVTSDGRLNFKINPKNSYIHIPNDALKIQLTNDPNSALLNNELSIFTEEVKKNLFNGQNLKVVTDLLSNHVSEKVMPKLDTALQNAQKNNFAFKHALTPFTAQTLVADSLYKKYKASMDANKATDAGKVIADTKAVLKEFKNMADTTPTAAAKIAEYSQKVKDDLEALYRSIKDKPENKRGSLLNPINLVQYTFSDNDAEKVESLIKVANKLAKEYSEIDSEALDKKYSKTEVRIFSNANNKDYLYYATITCPNQASLIDREDKKVEFYKPNTTKVKPDFVINISEASLNSFLAELHKKGLLDVNVTKHSSLQSINFTGAAPFISLGENGKFKINFKAKMRINNIPDGLTDEVNVEADLKFGITGDSIILSQENLRYNLGVDNKEIGVSQVLTAVGFKLPLNLFIPLLTPITQSQKDYISKIPGPVLDKVQNLRVNTNNGHILLSGNLK
ncbi:MAG: hypothetical protein U0T83_01190 [Bacteriovoracaceae bacterium]